MYLELTDEQRPTAALAALPPAPAAAPAGRWPNRSDEGQPRSAQGMPRPRHGRTAKEGRGGRRRTLAAGVLGFALQVSAALHQPAPIEEYSVHRDGGLVYDPLRREAETTGQLAKYAGRPTTQGLIELGEARLRFSLPQSAGAYDVVPIPYTLEGVGRSGGPVAVEAVAFQDVGRAGERDLYDLALPNRIDLGVEYLGSISAHLAPELKHYMAPDGSDRPSEYPGFRRQPMTRSGIVEAGDLVWFKFRLTNVGDTILDPDGFGGCQLYPQLLRRNAKGEYEPFAEPYNLYYRNVNYWYPGEKWEPWLIFRIPAAGQPAEYYRIEPGDYVVRIRLTYRSYRDASPYLNNWDGPVVFTYDQPLTVAAHSQEAPVPAGSRQPSAGDYEDKLTRFIHTFEEFMTAFDCHLDPGGTSGDGAQPITGTLYLQVAPWTRQVVLRLICPGPTRVRTAAVPIRVEADTLAIVPNPAMPNCVIGEDGKRWPIFMTQMMADMRTNVQLGPFPEYHIRNRLREMKQHGVNVVATTSMPWLYDLGNRSGFNYPGDAWKYALDVARAEKLRVEAWGQYSYDRVTIGAIASWVTGRDLSGMPTVISGYGDGTPYVSRMAPSLPAAHAAVMLYHFRRWGDLFLQLENGVVPCSTEDTLGWMRDDVNVRFPVGELGVQAFRAWLVRKYGSLEGVNRAWNSSFATLEAVQPETGKADLFGQKWSYADPSHPFHDWNQAVEDYDTWRTQVRLQNYRETLEGLAGQIPNARIALRTEGGNALVAGLDPQTPNAHLRHVYYSQRRVAAIAEEVVASSLVGFHSDYTSLPYTPSELRELVRAEVRQGIVPAYLPYFNDMRDIALNRRHGLEYQVHYNIASPTKGYMIHVLTASYPWYRVMVEEGGIAGIEWEDYQCVAFATETQKREMRLFQEQLAKAFATPEGERLRTQDIRTPAQEWRRASMALRSYYGPDEAPVGSE